MRLKLDPFSPSGISIKEEQAYYASGGGGVSSVNGHTGDVTVSSPFVTVGFADADYICDGTADDVQIQAAIDAVEADGGGIVFIKHGTYALSSNVTVPDSVILKYDGPNAVFMTGGNATAILALLSSVEVTFADDAGVSSVLVQNSGQERIFQLKSDGDSYMDFRIHNSPYNETLNGYFQDWDTSSSPWAWGTLGGAVLAQESGAANKRLGSYSCKITTATAGDALIQFTPRANNEGINVTVALCYKKSSGTTNLWLAAYDTSTGTIHSEMELDSVHDGKTLDFGLGWFRPRLTYAPNGPGNTIGIKIYQKAAGNAVYYIDEVQVHEGDGEYAWTDQALVIGHEQHIAANKLFRKDYKLKFRDDNQYIHSDASGYMALAATTALKINTALQVLSTAKTSSFTVGADMHYPCDAAAGDITVSFPNASGLDGRTYLFTKKTAGNKVILDAFGGQLVGLAPTLTLQLTGDYAIVVATEGHWRLVSTNVGNDSVYQEAQTASFTAAAAGSYACDATGGAITVSFGTASNIQGTRYTIIKTDASANAVTLDAFGSQVFLLGGVSVTTIALVNRYDAVTIEAQGGQWVVIGSNLFTWPTGRTGGQTIIGGLAAGNNLTLQSSSHATKGKILLGTASGYDEVNDRLGLATTVPTHSLTLGSTSTGISLYNTSDQTTNYERGVLSWVSNALTLSTANAGSGADRRLNLVGGNVAGATATLSVARSGLPFLTFTHSAASSLNGLFTSFTPLMSSSNGTQVGFAVTPTISQSSSGAYTGLQVNVTESSTGSGAKLLLDLQVAGASKFSITNAGVANFPNFSINGSFMYFAAAGTTDRGVTADATNTVLFGPTNVYISTSGVDGTRVVMSSGTLRVGGPGRTAAALDMSAGGGQNIITDTTTGTKIGTATTQKLSLWNATPIVQPTTGVAAATFAANTSLIANDTATFDGYTLGQVVKALRNIGILA